LLETAWTATMYFGLKSQSKIKDCQTNVGDTVYIISIPKAANMRIIPMRKK